MSDYITATDILKNREAWWEAWRYSADLVLSPTMERLECLLGFHNYWGA